MASGSHYGGFFGKGYKIGFDWSSSRVGNENASNVTVVPYLYIKSGYSISSSASKSGTVTINGTNHNFNFTLGNVRGETWVRLSNGFTTKVGHNSDGSKSCTLKVTAKLDLNLSGSQVGTVSDEATVTLDKFNLNSAPTMPAGITVNPNGGYIPENGTSVTISWSKASDPDGNLSNHILDCCKNGTWMTWATLGKDTTSYTDTIPKGEGDTYQYRVIARDSAGLYSNHSNVSAKLTTNTLRGGSFSNAPSINDNTSSITMNFGGGSNTDGTAARYMCYSDDITIYNQTETTSGSQAITIYKSGSTPSGPYIRFDDLKNRFRNSNYNGRMHIGLRTGNGRGTYKYSSTTLSVDLRSNPSAPGAVTILQDSNSTAYKTHSGSGNKYFVPDGTNFVRFTYTAASDPLGGEVKYKLYQIYNGNVSLLAENVTGVGGYNFVPPKLSGNSTATLAFTVEAITSYGRSSSKDSAQITLHSYNGPSFSLGTITRTATDATVNITVKTTSSVPNINTVGTWSCNGKSGNLAASQSQQSFKVTGLTEGGTYTATVTYKDNTGWSSNQTANVSIGSLAPIMAITKEGLGLGGVEANANAVLNVKGNTIINEGKLTFSKQIGGGQMSSLINCQELQNGTGNGQIITASGNKVYVGNPNTPLQLESNSNPILKVGSTERYIYHTGNKPTPSDIGAVASSGGTISGAITVSGESKFHNGAYSDPWSGTVCAIKATGNIASTATIRGATLQAAGNGKVIQIGTGGSDVYIHNSAAGVYWQFRDNGFLGLPNDVRFHGSSERSIRLEGTNKGLYLNNSSIGFYDWANNTSLLRIDLNNKEVRADGGYFATAGTRMITSRAGNAYLSWGNSTDWKYSCAFYTNTGNNAAAPSLTNGAPTIKMYSGSGGGLHLFPAGDAAGGTVICKGTGWGSYGDVTCNKLYNMSDMRLKKNIQPLDDPSAQVRMLSLNEEETTGSIALDIIKKAKVYSYMHTYDDGSLNNSFGLMAQDLPVELTKQYVPREASNLSLEGDGEEDYTGTTMRTKKERNAQKEDIAVDVYGVASIAWEGVRVLLERIELLEKENDELKQELVQIKQLLIK